MAFPFGFKELSPEDLKTFRKLYEETVNAEPLNELGKWFLQTYDQIEAGEFTEALSRLDLVFQESPDYSSFIAAKHVLSQVEPNSAVSYQVARRLLAHRSPLLFRYGLCIVIAGETLIDREITDAVAQLSSKDEETMSFAQVAKVAIQTGAGRHV